MTEEGDSSAEEAPVRSVRRPWLLVGGGLLGVLVITGGFLGYRYLTMVSVPALVGIEVESAEQQLSALELAVGEKATEFSNDQPKGSVLSQEPAGGARVAAETLVDLVISLGPPVTVPAAEGLTAQGATALLAEAGLVVSTQEEASETVEEGLVTRQSVSPGTIVEQGTEVVLTTSTGPALQDVVSTVTFANFGRSLGFTSCGQIGLYFIVYYNYAAVIADDGETVGRLEGGWQASGNSVKNCKVTGNFPDVPTDRDRYSLSLLPNSTSLDAGWKTRQEMIDADWKIAIAL